MTPEYRLLASMHDFAGEGIDAAMARIREAGVGGVTIATAYHTARDIFPHNPAGPVIYHEGGTVYFDPDLERYDASPLQPLEAGLTRGTHLAAEVIDRGREAAMSVGAWVVLLHNTRLAMAHPDCAQETATGDRLLHGLCPTNPEVRSYAIALVEDTAAHGFDHLLLESLSFMPFEHGYHHEREVLGLDARTRFLLGLCFCEHCISAGKAAGVDVAGIRKWAVDEIDRVLGSGDALSVRPPSREWAWEVCNGELGRFLETRVESVIQLAEAVRHASAGAGIDDVVFIDPSGATLGYSTGIPDSPERAVDIGWRQGIAVDRLAPVTDVAATAYFATPDRLSLEVDGYNDVLPPDSVFHIILRPMPPDTYSASELLAKLQVVASKGVETVSFYHYGLMRLESIGWIQAALSRITEGAKR